MSSRTRKKDFKVVKRTKTDKNVVLEHGPNLTAFKTFKVPLKTVLNPEYAEELEELVLRIDDLIFHTYQFIRGYVLYRIGEDFSGDFRITREFIRYSIRVLGDCVSVKPRTSVNLYSELEEYYTIYQAETKHEKTDLTYLSHFTANIAIEVQTAIETNIRERFVQHFSRLVNKLTLNEDSTNEDKRRVFKLKKQLLTFDFKNVEDEFSLYVELAKYIFPETIQESVYYDVKRQPLAYLKGMVYMNRILEDRGLHSFNDLPLRTESIPKNTMIDSSSLASYFIRHKPKERSKVVNNVNENKDWMWREFLNFDHSVFKSKNYTFYHQIKTDGVSCSLLFVRKDLVQGPTKTDVVEEYSVTALKFPELVNERTPEEYASRLVGCDPGKRSLVYLSDGVEKLQFTAPQRRFESWSGRRDFTVKKMRNEHVILSYEGETFTAVDFDKLLSENRHNSTYHDKFLEYCGTKTFIRNETSLFYRQRCFRTMRLRTWIRGRSSVDKFVNSIGKTFGEDCVIAYGDWSRTTQMRGCMPSLGVGLRRLIHRKYRTFSVQEAYTSKRCSNCGCDMENVKGKLRDGSIGKIHRLKCCSGCVSSDNKNVVFKSRDLNAAKNILQVGLYWCFYQRRHPWFESVPHREVCDVVGQN